MRGVWFGLVLTGCFSRHEPIRDAIHAEQDDPVRAEALWKDLLDEELTTAEWGTVSRRFCRLREARLLGEVPRLGDASPAQIRALRAEASHCPDEAVQVQLMEAEVGAARAAFSAIASQPGSFAKKLEDAAAIEALHPPEEAFVSQLADWRETWVEEVARVPSELPATRAWLDRMAGRVDGRESNLADLAAADLALRLERAPVELDASCAALGSAPDAAVVEGTGERVSMVLHVEGCTTTSSTKQVDVSYETTEMQQKAVPYEVRETVVTEVPRMGRSCQRDYEAGVERCTTYVAYTVREYNTVTRTETRMESVPVTVTRTRKEPREVRTVSMQGRVELETPSGLLRLNLSPVQFQEQSATPLAAKPVFENGVSDFTAQATDIALNAAQKARLDRAVADFALTPEAIERRMLAVESRPLTDSEESALAGHWSWPREMVGQSDLTPRSYADVERDLPTWRVPSGTIRNGFSPVGLRTALSYHTADVVYPAHGTPTSIEIDLGYEGNVSLTTGRAASGFGVHLVPATEFHFGTATQRRHVFVDPSETQKPPRMAVGGGASLGGMLGVRTSPMALFAGVGGLARLHALGGTVHGRVGLPLVGRLELRPTPRDPVVVSGWFGDVLQTDSRDWGGRIDLPLRRGVADNRLWLSIQHRRDTERVQLPGVNADQRVDGGQQSFQRSSVGVLVGL